MEEISLTLNNLNIRDRPIEDPSRYWKGRRYSSESSNLTFSAEEQRKEKDLEGFERTWTMLSSLKSCLKEILEKNNMATIGGDDEFGTIRFLIEVRGDTKMNPMKNVSYNALLMFLGKMNEDPDAFLFKFDILCRSYDYLIDEKKLKLFLIALKSSTLCWFMDFPEGSIQTWSDMKKAFLGKY